MRSEEMQSVNSLALLKGNFLISTPLLIDPVFNESIVFITEFKDISAYGFLVDYRLRNPGLVKNVKEVIESSIFHDADIFLGGPMHHDHFFLIHSKDVCSKKSLYVSNNICVTNLDEALRSFKVVPHFYKIVIGYCSWQSGQLYYEVKDGLWVLQSFNESILFENLKNKWKKCINSLKIDVKKFALSNGYA